MAQVNTISTLNGLFKTVYADEIKKLQPENTVLQNIVKFRESEKLGKSFSVPVILSSEQGVTYSAAGDGAVSLNASVSATMKEALIDGANIFLRGQIEQEAISKAAVKGERAFQNATQLMVENLMDSAARRLEIAMMYGQSGLATVASLSGQVITITTGQFASGIWAGMEGATIDVYTSGGSVRQAGLVISSVDLDNRAITVTGTTTGIVSTDKIYFKGSYGKEMVGLDKIITNTGSLFGIDASAYALWAGSTYSAGSAALTMAKVLSAVSKAVAKGGLMNEDVVCLVNPLTWSNLNSDQAALRQYVDKDSKAQNGFEAIEYRGQSGKISVISSNIVKEGEAFIFPPKRLKRVGSQEFSFSPPGHDGSYLFPVPDMNAYELRLFANQSLFCETPAKCVKITGIVNS